MKKTILFLFLFSLIHSVHAQVNLVSFDVKKSTTVNVTSNCQVVFSTSAIKATIQGKDLTVSPNAKIYPSYTKQLNSTDFDIGLIFKVKPSTDTVYFKIDGYQDFDFWYQDGKDIDGKISKDTPDNVIGSYAVYRKGNGSIGSGGKACHIYRAKLIDKNLNELYCTMYYLNGQLAVKFDKDRAIYPAILDPIMGYSPIGATASTQLNAYWEATDIGYTTENITVTSMTLCIYNVNVGLYSMHGALYSQGVGTLDKVAGSEAIMLITQATKPTQDSEWTTKEINANLIAGVTYFLAVQSDHIASYIARDNIGSNTLAYYTRAYDGIMPATTGGVSTASQKFSSFVIYTIGGGATEYKFPKQHEAMGKGIGKGIGRGLK
jgi:hypothetical protein